MQHQLSGATILLVPILLTWSGQCGRFEVLTAISGEIEQVVECREN